ncbi:MAG: nucleotide exchange factor GrpE [Emergencia sp.]|nr:nucleotide exchange factor GrpE [Emergencia sp.]
MNQEELKEEQKAEDLERAAGEAEAEKMPEDDAAEAEASGESDEKEEDAKAENTEEDEALNTKYLRLMADFQNYKRRAEKEKGDIYAYANEKIVVELLDVLDNFERALQHEAADESFAEGMRMIFKQLTDVLEKSGLEEIKAQGEEFDPNFHNAVMTEDNPDYESGKVTAVLQKGYLLNKKVIRPSMVKVNN